jgi:SM-20-related protein
VERIINLAAIRNAEVHAEPFAWAFIGAVFESRGVARALADEFPAEGYERYTRHSTAKRYDTHGRFLIKMGHKCIDNPDGQPEIWRQFAQELLSDEYVSAVEEVTGEELRSTHLEAVFWRLPEGSVIDPHTDSPLKKVSHLFYFNDEWSPDDGGCLRLLRSWRMNDVAYEIPPLLNTSVLLRRSGNSWHGYEPVRGPQVRKAVQISFCLCAAV